METAEKPRESGKRSGEQEGEKKEERPKLNIEKVQKLILQLSQTFLDSSQNCGRGSQI